MHPSPAPRRAARIAALVALAVGAWAVAAWRIREGLRGPDDAAARAAVEALHAARDRALARDVASLDATYAAALPGTVALQELLIAAGVPRFLPVAGADALRALPSPGPRLVLAGVVSPESARALCGADRAVITHTAPGPRAVRAMRMEGITAPMDARAEALSPLPGEAVLATDEGGAPLAVIGPCEGGVLVRLAFDLGAELLRQRQGDPARGDRDHDGNGELQPADLSAPMPPALQGVAWADALVDGILAALDRGMRCPLPRLATLPPGDGPVVVLTADQDYASDEVVEAMAERLQSRRARARPSS